MTHLKGVFNCHLKCEKVATFVVIKDKESHQQF